MFIKFLEPRKDKDYVQVVSTIIKADDLFDNLLKNNWTLYFPDLFICTFLLSARKISKSLNLSYDMKYVSRYKIESIYLFT